MASYYSKDAQCPYYEYDDPAGRAVVCEGPLPGATVRSRFQSKEQYRKHLERRCCSQFEKCHWYKIITLKYKPED